MQLRTGFFSRIGYKVKKVFWVGTLGLTSLTPAACRYRYSCTEIIRKAPPKKISICTSRDGKTVIIGKGKQQIVFISFENRYRIDKEIDDIKRLYKLISEVNTLIPSMPLQKVTVVSRDQIKKWKEEGRDPFPGGYIGETHELIVGFYPNYIETLFHEAGHAVFRVILGGKIGTAGSNISIKDELWQKIFFLSFAHNNIDLVRDSKYIKSKKGEGAEGHPWDDASEFFASSFMIYRLYPNEFIKRILGPNTKKETRKFGKLIFIYLRDKIFKDKVFSSFDPFKGESLVNITKDELLNSLCLSVSSKNPFSQQRARNFIVPSRYMSRPAEFAETRKHLLKLLKVAKLNKKSCMGPITKSFSAPEDYVRAAAAGAAQSLRMVDANLSSLLMKSAEDPSPLVRAAAAKAIGSLGIKGEITVTTLIKALGDSDSDVRVAVAIAIGLLRSKDRRFVAPLIKALKDPNPKVRATAAGTIEWLGIKDKRFIVPLIQAAADSDPDTRANAIKAIGELGVRNKKIIKLLIQAMADNNFKVRMAVARAIVDLRLKEENFITLLIKALNDKNSVVRMVAAMSLGEIGGKKIIPILKKRLTDPNEYVRKAIKKAIKEIEKREAGI